jgi:hypothetical protein
MIPFMMRFELKMAIIEFFLKLSKFIYLNEKIFLFLDLKIL